MLKETRIGLSQAALACTILFALALTSGCQDGMGASAPADEERDVVAVHPESAPKTAEHPTAKTAEHPTAKTAEHSTAKAAKHPTAKTSEHLTAKTAEHPTAQVAEHPTAKAPEHPTAKAAEHPVAPPTESAVLAKASAAVSKPIVITDADFNDKIQDGIVLVDFWADWCGWCHRQAPILNTLAGEYAGKIVIGKIDTDRYPEAARRNGVRGLPTMILFKDGKRLAKLEGFRPEAALRQAFDAALSGTLSN